jgi:hypothetical protein
LWNTFWNTLWASKIYSKSWLTFIDWTLKKFIFWNKWNKLLSPQPTTKVSFYVCFLYTGKKINWVCTLFLLNFFGALRSFRINLASFISIRKLWNSKKKIFQIFRKFENIFFYARSIFFFQKTKISMEICQRQEDWGCSIISNTSLNGLAN